MDTVTAILLVILATPFLAPYPIWFFAIRPFVAKHHRPRITAVGWFFSMWADWTTAREIEKKTGKRFWASRLFFWIWAYILGVYCLLFGLLALQS